MPAESQSFDFETIAVVLYAMLETGTGLGEKHYAMMSAIDGKRTKSAFEHQFRKVKARAKELQDQAKKGESVRTPVKGKLRGVGGSAVKSGGGGSAKSGGGKRSKYFSCIIVRPSRDRANGFIVAEARANTPNEEDKDDNGTGETPSKKGKIKPEVEHATATFDYENEDFQ